MWGNPFKPYRPEVSEKQQQTDVLNCMCFKQLVLKKQQQKNFCHFKPCDSGGIYFPHILPACHSYSLKGNEAE